MLASPLQSMEPSRRARWLLRDFWLITAVVCTVGAPILAVCGFWFLPSALALLLVMQCVYPAVRYAVERESVVPAIPIMAGAYALQFALPVFIGDATVWLIGGFKDIGENSLSAALATANAAFAVFLFVAHSRSVGVVLARMPVFRLELNRTRATVFVLVFGVFGLIATRIAGTLPADAQVQFGAIVRVFQNQALVAIGVLAWLTYTNPSPFLRTLYYLFIGASVFEGLSSGFLEAVLIPIGITFACQWIYRRRINTALLVALALVMLLLNPVKGEYRERVWYSADVEYNAFERAGLWVTSGIDYWWSTLNGEAHASDAAVQLARRTSMVDILAHIEETTPDSVPYLMGETYSFFAYSLIPRFLWPDKPTATANRTLAIQYLLTTPEGTERTTFGVSLVGEGYANFGLPGAIGIMALLALLLRGLQHAFARPESGPGGYALFLAFFIFFLNGLGSSAEILFGNLLQSMIASSLLIYWATDRASRAASAMSSALR